jgi:chromosome segregation ATPase
MTGFSLPSSDQTSCDETDTDILPRPLPVPSTPPIMVQQTRPNAECSKQVVDSFCSKISKLNEKGLESDDGTQRKILEDPCKNHSIEITAAEAQMEKSFENRLKEIVAKLSDIGLLPIQAQRILNQVPEDYVILQYDAPIDHHILNALQLCQNRTKSDLPSSNVHSLLVLIEALIDETMYLSQTYEEHHHPITGSNDAAMSKHQTLPMPSQHHADDLQNKKNRNNAETSMLRNLEVEMKHHLQLEVTHLRRENERLRLEINDSYAQHRQLEEMLQNAIAGDRSAIKKEVEQTKAQGDADVHEHLMRILGLQSMLSRKDSELHYQHDIINRLQAEIKNLAYMHEAQAANIVEKDRDNLVMKREGQALAIENTTLHSELSSIRQRLDEEIQRADNAQQFVQTSRLANNELSADRKCLQENLLRVESEFERLRLDHTITRQELTSIQDENRRLKSQIQSLGCDIQKRVSETATLERIRDDLVRKCEAMKRSLQNQETEKEKMQKELIDIVGSQEDKTRQLIDLQRMLVTSEKEMASMTSRLADIQSECTILQKLLEQERLKRHEYDEMLSTGRAKEKAATEQIKMLLKEKASLSTRLNEANIRMVHLSLRSTSNQRSNNVGALFSAGLKTDNSTSTDDKVGTGQISDTIISESHTSDDPCEECEGNILQYLIDES